VVHGPVEPVYENFFNEINSLNQYFQEFCKEAPVFLPKRSLASEKSTKIAPKF
jgi:hypothetical protein